MALKMNPYWRTKFCRWSEKGMCDFTEQAAFQERVTRLANYQGDA